MNKSICVVPLGEKEITEKSHLYNTGNVFLFLLNKVAGDDGKTSHKGGATAGTSWVRPR